jgi:hypothetical protein
MISSDIRHELRKIQSPLDKGRRELVPVTQREEQRGGWIRIKKESGTSKSTCKAV